MRGLVDELKGALTWFVQEQREHFAIIVSYEDEDAAMVFGVLNGIDQSDPGTLVLPFAHEARTERAYVDVMLELMGTRREVLNAARAARGTALIPPPPFACLDAGRPGAERIRHILAWWRSSLTDPEQPIVLVLAPSALPNPEVYRQVVWGLLPFAGFEPWMRNLRLVIRDRRNEPFIRPLLRETPCDGVLTYTADFSPTACEEGLAADAANRGLSPRDRGMAMLQLAALDYSHQRFPAAMEKYGLLANLFSDLGEKALAALCLCGAADIHQRVGDLEKARARYLQGVETAAAAQAKSVVLNCLIGLGQTTYSMQRFTESESAWDAAARVAGSMGNPYGVVDAVEQVGVARLARGRPREAVVVWERALELMAQHPYGHREVSMLQRMVDLAREQGAPERDSYEARLAIAKRRESEQGGAA